MDSVVLTPITKEVKIIDCEQRALLSTQRNDEIEDFWLKINHEGRFHRGEVYTVADITEDDNFFKVLLKETDYAHYLHTVKNQITDSEACKVIYGAGLVETNDSKLVFGQMAENTAYPGRLQCVGGGLSNEDKIGDHFDIKESVLRELSEELGSEANKHVESCNPIFFKKGGPYGFYVVLFHIKLRIDAEQLKSRYQLFTKELIENGDSPEFQNVIYLDKNKESIIDFIKNDDRASVDYLKPLLEKVAESLEGNGMF